MVETMRYRTDIEDSARWDGFVFRPGDIVISAPSKSGTTWTQMICALLVFQTPELPEPLTRLSPWLDMCVRPVDEVREHLAAQEHRRFVKTHTPLDGLPADDRATYIAVCRDPRDVAVSLQHQDRNLNRDLIRRLVDESEPGRQPEASVRVLSQAPVLTERERLQRWINDDAPPLGNLDTLRGFIVQMNAAWERRHHDNVVLLHYNDLSRDLEGQMRRLAGRLSIAVAEETWPALVEAATFAQMRQRSTDLVPDERLGIMKDADKFFRSGSSGEWRQILTDSDLARYDERVAAFASPDLAEWMHHGTWMHHGSTG